MHASPLNAEEKVGHMFFLEPKVTLGWFLEILTVILSNSHTQTKAIKIEALEFSHYWKLP